MDKLLAHFTARGGRKAELVAELPGLAARWRDALGGAPVRATVLAARDDDPMRRTGDQQPARAFDATLELKPEAPVGGPEAGDSLAALVEGLGAELEGLVQADLCALQIGSNEVFIACEPTAIRFQYCMRRRHDFGVADYLARYVKVHSRFGLDTKGIAGYVQLHVDPQTTRRACAAAGFGVQGVDSVSELHIESLEAFFAEWEYNAKNGATEDEERFVDRANSVMWLSDEIFRLGT